MQHRIKQDSFSQKKSLIDELVSSYKGFTDDQTTDELNDLTNKLYALLLATDCLSFEILFGRDVSLFIELKEKQTASH